MLDRHRSLTKRALCDSAIASLVEIETRDGKNAELTKIVGALLDYGHRYDAEDDQCVACGGVEADHQSNYYCREFKGR